MRRYKEDLLKYGTYKKGYYSPDEYKWCMKGKNIKDYEKPQRELEKKIDDISIGCGYNFNLNVSRVNTFTNKLGGRIKIPLRR